MPRPGPLPASYWVLDDLLLAGPYPGSPDDGRARDKIGWLLDAGVRVFVNLTERGELLPYEAILQDEARARGIDVEHVRVPIRNLDVPSERDLARTLVAIDEALRANRPVYVHCWGGIGRTGTIVGCWLAQSGHPGDTALARLAELRDGCDPECRTSPETERQRALVTSWTRDPGPRSDPEP